ncbi:MAG TPA: hypothetical protein VN039_11090 [Nitrospira sp.]|nr:hypothetical protein [Nitrospira sp.]
MAGRKTIEAKVVEWFETAEVETAWVVLWIVAGKMRERERSGRVAGDTPRHPKAKERVVKKTQAVMATTTQQVANAAD